MARWNPRAVLDWLRAGYPEGIPAKDHFALLAVLKRRLTDEELLEAIETAAATASEHRNDRSITTPCARSWPG